ncbi:O-methyltransferase [Candidatus Magnetomorum sp. HK-1]|nr:O-methyltransferase [Candidatus Magnetomorum sp. HK-1]
MPYKIQGKYCSFTFFLLTGSINHNLYKGGKYASKKIYNGMIQEREQTIESCLDALAPGGRLYIVDFGDLSGLGRIGQKIFHTWLNSFHVNPKALTPIFDKADVIVNGSLNYWKRAVFFR